MKTLEIEITFEREVYDEDCDFMCFPTILKGGVCTCGNEVYTDERYCKMCGTKLKFIPFKPIKTDLTPKQYAFLKNYTTMDKIEISLTTKEQARKIIGEKIEQWKLEQEHRYDSDPSDYDYDMYEEPF